MPDYAGIIKFPVAADKYNTEYGEQQWWRDMAVTARAEIEKQVSDAIKGRSPVGHNHDERYQLVLPITLGSTDDLDAITAPRRYRCISSGIAGNPALHYPPGAVHGFLDVIEMGTGYRWQLWNDTWNHWQAARRLYAGAWTPWTRLAKADADAAVARVAARVEALENAAATEARVAVQPGSMVVYGPDRPDAWAHPGTTVYWHHPTGTEMIPPTYRGDGYVGRLADATGYSQMLVTKAEASGTVDVSCINPTTGRHVTYRVQGAWDGAAGGIDAFQRVEETWVGAVTGGVPSPDTLILPRSNIEWAFQIDVGGNRQFVPHHGAVTAVDAGATRGLFRMDGTTIDLSALAVGGTITGLNGVKHRQSVYARHPDSGTTDWVRIDQVLTISPDGMLQSESTWTALRDVVIGSNYAPMTPVQVGLVDRMHVLGGASYPIDTTPPAATRYDTVGEGKNISSALFTGPGSEFVAVAFLDPAATLLRDHPLSETSTPVRIENRSGGGLVKLYPSGFDTAVTVPAGTVWRMGAQWRYGEAENAAQYA